MPPSEPPLDLLKLPFSRSVQDWLDGLSIDELEDFHQDHSGERDRAQADYDAGRPWPQGSKRAAELSELLGQQRALVKLAGSRLARKLWMTTPYGSHVRMDQGVVYRGQVDLAGVELIRVAPAAKGGEA